MYRIIRGEMEVLLVHPGGLFWRHKDEGAWSIPKGEIEADEAPLPAAQREFEEETGIKPSGEFMSLDSTKLKSGKTIQAWAFEGDCDPTRIKSNTFSLEWPPKSGKIQEFAEIDQAAFWPMAKAKIKISPAQVVFLERLEKMNG